MGQFETLWPHEIQTRKSWQGTGKFPWPDHVAPCGIIVKMLMVFAILEKNKSYYFITINFLSVVWIIKDEKTKGKREKKSNTYI